MDAHPDLAEKVYRKVAFRLIPILILCYIFAFLDRANIGFAKLQFDDDLGFDEAIYGLGGGLFYLGYSLFEVPSNLMLARIGARKTLLRIMLLWSLAASALAFISQPAHFYILRFLLGAAEAGFFPGVLFYLTIWIPPARRARFTMLFMSAIVVSGLIGSPVSGFIMQYLNGWAGLKGWQWLFLLEGMPAGFLGLLAYVYLDDNPASAKWLSDGEKTLILADLRREEVQKQGRSHSSFWAAMRDVRFYALTGMSVALIAGIGALFLWMPTIIRQMGVTDVWHIGLISVIPFFAALVAQFLVARHSDRRQERRWHAALPALVAAAGWLLLPMASGNPVLALVLLTVTAMGTFGATAPFWSMPALFLSGTAAAGGIAVITTVGGLGAFFSPTIVGYVTARTGTLAFAQYYYGILMLAGALVLLLGTARGREASAEAAEMSR
jgi:MFS family permease